MPRFSVVIPTKNRPDYLADSIFSVLNQSFEDLECIVSDNHNDERTQAVIERFAGDTRLRSVRPGKELNMPDHWEFATSHASGEYVILLADRKVLYRDGLSNIDSLIQEQGTVDAGSVGVRTFDEKAQKMSWYVKSEMAGLLDPGALIRNFYDETYFEHGSWDPYFPKTLNGFFRREFADKIRKDAGCYFNIDQSITPDYSSFFVNAARAEKLAHVPAATILTQGESISHGRNFGKGDYSYYMNSLRWDDPYSFVPYKRPFIYSLLYQDSFAIREVVGGRLLDQEPNWKMYAYNNAFELQRKIEANVLSVEEKKDFTEAFEEMLMKLPLSDSEKDFASGPLRGKFAKEVVRDTPFVDRLKDHIKHRYGHLDIVNRVFKHRFKDVKEAAGFS